jgi:4-hydroxy-tetrahydrodipicolinate reductase
MSEAIVSAATGVGVDMCILGPSGRMGREVLALCGARSDVRVVAAVDAPGSEIIGSEVVPGEPGVLATDDLAAGLARAHVYIDFTTPAATRQAAEQAYELGVAAVIGTTGLDARAEAAIARLSERAPVLVAANFSLGVNVLLGLAERAARALGPEFDIEVVEIHHKHKRDAPSGTALALAGALNRGRGGELARRLERQGDVGARPENELGVVAVRGGDVAGEHTAYFLGPGERLEITHRAGSRAIFAAGALRAAAWLAGKPAGRYSMSQVLGL